MGQKNRQKVAKIAKLAKSRQNGKKRQSGEKSSNYAPRGFKGFQMVPGLKLHELGQLGGPTRGHLTRSRR